MPGIAGKPARRDGGNGDHPEWRARHIIVTRAEALTVVRMHGSLRHFTAIDEPKNAAQHTDRGHGQSECDARAERLIGRQAECAKCHDRGSLADAPTGKRDGEHGYFHDRGYEQRATYRQGQCYAHAAQDEQENQHIGQGDQAAENDDPSKPAMIHQNVVDEGRCLGGEGRSET